MNWFFKNLHLIISVLIVFPTGIIYGSPSILPRQLDIQVTSIDLANMLKAIMCLYIGISFIWGLGILKAKYWKKATEINILFMLTLGIGRGLSIAIDGLPTKGYIFGMIIEFILGAYSIYQLKKYNKSY
ncbi:conserved membrane protein of unknown function [Tenacibaculum soleae]|uniref:DUF4345 domain-containing protein n=1 Tax=Tenacibaculum soleae TaxID=447689 RepID=UPI003AB61C1C